MSARHQQPALPRVAALYPRVSDPAQDRDEKTSLKTQEAGLRAHAATSGYAVREEYVYRERHTAEELWERPELTRLRADAKAGRFALVLVHSVERLSRNAIHAGIVLEELETYGVAVHFVAEPLDLSTPDGQLLAVVKSYSGQIEAERKKDRVHRATRARAQAGHLIPGIRALYGYTWGPERYTDGPRAGLLRKIRLVPDPVTAPIVQRIFREYHAGASLRRIAAGLTADGIPTPTGGTTWSVNTLGWILWHPTYSGAPAALRWQSVPVPKSVRSLYRNKSRKVSRPAEQQIALDAATAALPLVSPELAAAVHARLREQQVLGTANRHNRFPELALLRGHAYCADCEHALAVWTAPVSRGSATLRTRYQCRRGTRPPTSGVCCTPVRNIEAHKLDTAVWAKLCEVLRDRRLIEREVARMRELDAAGEQPGADALAAIDRRITQLEERIAKKRKYAEMVGDDRELETTAAETRALIAERNGYEAERANAVLHYADWRDQQAGLEQTLDLLATRAGRNLDTMLYEEKRGVLRALKVRVLLHAANARPRAELLLHLPLSGQIVLDLLDALNGSGEGNAEPALALAAGGVTLVQKEVVFFSDPDGNGWTVQQKPAHN